MQDWTDRQTGNYMFSLWEALHGTQLCAIKNLQPNLTKKNKKK